MFISGFPGIGKSHFCEHNSLNTHDSDSSSYSKLPDGSPNPNFIDDYFEHLENLQYIPGLMIMVSTHEAVLAELKSRGMNYCVVIPEESLHDEYMRRYKERGSPQSFIDLISSNWYMWLRDIKQKHNCFELKSGQTLTDFIIETYETGHDGTNAMNFK